MVGLVFWFDVVVGLGRFWLLLIFLIGVVWVSVGDSLISVMIVMDICKIDFVFIIFFFD